MKFSKLGLLTLLISLFIFNSCKNQDGIGLGVDAGNQLNGTILVDTSMIVTTVPEDSVITSALVRTPLSYFKDPEFGTTEANMVAAVTLPGSSAYTAPTGSIKIDSVRLVLPYTEGFYGDSLISKYKVNVHQLEERIVPSKAYYNNKQWAFTNGMLGTTTFTARPHDTIKIFNIIKGKPDTLIRVSPQLRVTLDTAFIRGYILDAPSIRASNSAFQNAFKGIYITLDKAQTTGVGGNLMFALDSARINVYMRATTVAAGVTTIDTSILALPIQGTAHAAQIKHTFSAKIQAAIANPAADGSFYLQGLAGLRAKVSFPNIKNIFTGIGEVVLNRAEIIIKTAPNSTIPYRALDKLTMYQFDIAKQRIQVQDASATDPRGTNGPAYFGGFYDKVKGEYHFNVTGYVQDLLQGRTADYGTFIAPVSTFANNGIVDITPTAQFAERVIAGGKNSPYRIRLNVIYTKINNQ